MELEEEKKTSRTFPKERVFRKRFATLADRSLYIYTYILTFSMILRFSIAIGDKTIDTLCIVCGDLGIR